MLDISKLHCYRFFVPLKIVNIKKNGKSSNLYKVIKGKKQKIGEFRFSDYGYISNLVIKRKYRRTKLSAFSLLSILNFVKDFANKKGLDYFSFTGLSNNPENVVRLYSKITTPIPEIIGNKNLFIVFGPISKAKQTLHKKEVTSFIESVKNDIEKIISV